MGSHDAYSKPAVAPKDQQRKTARQATKRKSRAESERDDDDEYLSEQDSEDDTDSDLTAKRQKRPYRRKGGSHNVSKYGGPAPMPALPADYKRETIAKILEMFHRSDYIIEGGGKEFMACPEAKADAYFDTYTRQNLELVAWQRISLAIPGLEPWDFLDSIPDKTTTSISTHGCMILATVRYYSFPLLIWCRVLQRIKTWSIRSVAITKPSLIRGSQEEWNNVITQGDMSHVCHISTCENPFHIVLETHEANTSREYCRRPMVNDLKCSATWDSLRLEIMQGCSHQPKYFSIGDTWMDSVSGRFGGVPA